ncbi:methylenetetrahydrofolate reductase [Paracoccus methylarcula]|nr:methylenetetrahydrofolate reductase [Paracoccus methylarcula]
MTNLTPPGNASTRPGLLHADISMELPPEMVDGFDPDPGILPRGTKIFLTHIAGKDVRAQIHAAKRLLSVGYVPVVHMGAHNFETEEEYVRLVQAHSRNGVTHGLFLGGNPRKHDGPFHEALDLLNHDVLRDANFTHALIGGYPEGHPDIGLDALENARRRKLEACHARAMSPEIISQFAFDGDAMAAWANRIAAEEPGLPIRLGLAGVTSLPNLIRFAVLCGVGPSTAVLKKNAGGFMKIMADHDPGGIIEGIETGYFGTNPLNLHFFPFGGWKKTLAWIGDRRAC